MHSLPGMIPPYLAVPFYTEGVFAWDIYAYTYTYAYAYIIKYVSRDRHEKIATKFYIPQNMP